MPVGGQEGTLTVVAPSGFRVEGLSLAEPLPRARAALAHSCAAPEEFSAAHASAPLLEGPPSILASSPAIPTNAPYQSIHPTTTQSARRRGRAAATQPAGPTAPRWCSARTLAVTMHRTGITARGGARHGRNSRPCASAVGSGSPRRERRRRAWRPRLRRGRSRGRGGRTGHACPPRGLRGLCTGLAHSSGAPRQRPSSSPLLQPTTLDRVLIRLVLIHEGGPVYGAELCVLRESPKRFDVAGMSFDGLCSPGSDAHYRPLRKNDASPPAVGNCNDSAVRCSHSDHLILEETQHGPIHWRLPVR